jgi:very-short-patch-repair endonuclease
VKANHWFKLHPERAAAHVLKMHQVVRKPTSNLEKVVADMVPWMATQVQVGFYRVDVADPEKKIAIEVQGCWYHSCPLCCPNGATSVTQKQNRRNDPTKLSYLRNRGWQVIYVWEHAVVSSPSNTRALLLKLLEEPNSTNLKEIK